MYSSNHALVWNRVKSYTIRKVWLAAMIELTRQRPQANKSLRTVCHPPARSPSTSPHRTVRKVWLAAIETAEGMGLEPTTGYPAPHFQ